jgi:transcriptional regulator with XRE-family HTH domain
MDALRLGAVLRAVRIRRRLRQRDVAIRAGVSDVTVSRIERGQIDPIPFGTVSRVAAVLEIRVDFRAWSRYGDLDRLVNQRHNQLSEEVLGILERAGGWTVRAEVSFAIFGDRGSVDLLAWHPQMTSLLVVELKTEIVDPGEVLATLDRKRRLAGQIVARFGWTPAQTSVALVVSASSTNRRRLSAHARTVRSVLPDSTRRWSAFLRTPSGELAAVVFVPDRPPGTTGPRTTSTRRVIPRRKRRG